MMKIAVCDDDREIQTLLCRYIKEYFRKRELSRPDISCFDNGEELLEYSEPLDIVFVDVEMSGLNGIRVGQLLKERNKHVIIFVVTAYMDYLDEAMKNHVFRFLSKPIDKLRLFRNLKEALYQYNLSDKKVLVETREGAVLVRAEDIICIEMQGNHVFVHTTTRRIETVTKMREWDKRLDMKCFFHTHRSYIVNFRYIKAYSKEMVYLLGEEEMVAYLTRRNYKQFRDAYLLYLESVR